MLHHLIHFLIHNIFFSQLLTRSASFNIIILKKEKKLAKKLIIIFIIILFVALSPELNLDNAKLHRGEIKQRCVKERHISSS